MFEKPPEHIYTNPSSLQLSVTLWLQEGFNKQAMQSKSLENSINLMLKNLSLIGYRVYFLDLYKVTLNYVLFIPLISALCLFLLLKLSLSAEVRVHVVFQSLCLLVTAHVFPLVGFKQNLSEA